jgi:non-specific serine/threonine protein kinase
MDDAVSPLIAGRFRLIEPIGRGSTSEVYRAHDERSDAVVAIKLAARTLLAVDAERRYEREAAALAVLASPHVVRLVAAGSSDEAEPRPYLALELLEGRDLWRELVARGALPADEALTWLGQAAQALDLAHGVGLIHRDLKPGNLFLHHAPPASAGGAPTLVLKVLDFGLIKNVGEPGAADEAFAGTPLYMAPEQVRGHHRRVGPATDLWALGMVALHLLTGEPYWVAGSVGAVVAAVDGAPMYAPSERWPWLPRAVDVWFARACHRVAERRFRSAAELVAGLAAAIAAAGVRHEVVRPADPAAATLTASPIVLPGRGAHPPTASAHLVGRQVEVQTLLERLRDRRGALVTITGPAGVGKTCLAAAVAAQVAETWPDGAWHVPLGSIGAPEQLGVSLAETLGITVPAGADVVATLAAALDGRHTLVVLDGAEHVLAARERLARIVRACPTVTWLATSRIPLGIAGEERFGLEPLELPPPGPALGRDEALGYSAVALLLVRAREANPGLELDDATVVAAVEVSRLLDGLPLGLELAAAQARTLPLAEILAQLRAAPRAPGRVASGDETGAASGPEVPAAPTTPSPVFGVHSAVAWSHGRLSDAERDALAQLAVLPGGTTLVGAMRLLGGDAITTGALVATLVDASLVHWSGDEPPRLVMLETVRDYSAAAGGSARARHYRRALAMLEALTARAQPGRVAESDEAWLGLIDAEHDNLRAVMRWALSDAPAAALGLACRLGWFWYVRGHYLEGRDFLEAALAGASAEDASPAEGAARRRALVAAGQLALLSCDYAGAAERLEAAAALSRAAADRGDEAAAVQLLGSVARERGDLRLAEERHRRSLALWRALGDRREEGRSLNYLAFIAWLGAVPEAPPAEAELAGEAERCFAGLGDAEGTVWVVLNRAAAAHYAGAGGEARSLSERALGEATCAAFPEGIAWALYLLGLGSTARSEWTQAWAQLSASLRKNRRLGDLWRAASVIEALATVAVGRARSGRDSRLPAAEAAELALVLLAGAQALRVRLGTPVPRCEQKARTAAEADARAVLAQVPGGAARAARATAMGAGLDLDELAARIGTAFVTAWAS